MTNTLCNLRMQTEQDRRSVAEVIAEQARDSTPQLAWAEPDPRQVAFAKRGGRRSDFTPLQRAVPSWPSDLPLVEARLFWPMAALHVVAREDGGCAWSRIEELDAGSGNDEFMRADFPIYTIRDFYRFGLPEDTSITDLTAIEYRQRGRLVAWRLIARLEEQNNA